MRLVVPLTVVMPNHGPTQEDGIPRVSGSKPPSYPDDLLDSTDLSHLALACTMPAGQPRMIPRRAPDSEAIFHS